MMAEKSGSLAGKMSRSFDWDNDTCRPVLDRPQLLTSVVKRDEFCALLFVPRSLLPESVETKVKRNIIKWYVRRVSLLTDCDELIQEWLDDGQEAEASKGLPVSETLLFSSCHFSHTCTSYVQKKCRKLWFQRTVLCSVRVKVSPECAVSAHV